MDSRADNGSVGRGSNGSTDLDGSLGSWVSIHDQLTTSECVKCEQPYQRLNYFTRTIVVIYF